MARVSILGMPMECCHIILALSFKGLWQLWIAMGGEIAATTVSHSSLKEGPLSWQNTKKPTNFTPRFE